MIRSRQHSSNNVSAQSPSDQEQQENRTLNEAGYVQLSVRLCHSVTQTIFGYHQGHKREGTRELTKSAPFVSTLPTFVKQYQITDVTKERKGKKNLITSYLLHQRSYTVKNSLYQCYLPICISINSP